MTAGVCFSCGADKPGPFTQCQECSSTPRSEDELARSLALSGHLHSPQQLAIFAADIRAHRKLSFGPGVLDQAREAIRDPQLLGMLRAQKGSSGTGSSPRPAQSEGRSGMRPPTGASAAGSRPRAPKVEQPREAGGKGETKRKLPIRNDAPEATALDRTAFGLLGATTRDDRRRIVELAEEASLRGDADACARARSDLTNPRARVAAEITWLAGISPRRVHAYRVLIKHDLDSFLAYAMQEEPLVQANLIAAALERFHPELSTDDWAEWLCRLGEQVEEIDALRVLKTVNEDRAVAGFAEVQSVDVVEEAVAAQRRRYTEVVQEALERLPTQSMIEMIGKVVERATDAGTRHAPLLIDDLIDRFSLNVHGFLEKEGENVRTLVRRAAEAAPQGEPLVRPVVDKLEQVVQNWDRVAHPIHVCMKARGIEHEQSRALAYEIRSLGIDLFNKHGLLEQANRITSLLQKVFAEMPEVAERLNQDAEAIEGLFKDREEGKRRSEQWAKEITFEAEIGLLFKDALSISPAGIKWKGRLYPLDSIGAVGWGAIRHSVNGIPTGTEYSIVLDTKKGSVRISTKREDVFSGFIDRLWKAVGVRLLTEIVEGLRDGKTYHFGDAHVDDRGVVLTRRRAFLGDETARVNWGQLVAWSANGSLCLAPSGAKHAYVQLSYQEANNAHLLDTAIRIKSKNPSDRLSSILQ